MPTKRKYTDEDFIKAVESSISMREVFIKIGLAISGGNYLHFRKMTEKLSVSTDHFLGQGHLKGKTQNWRKRPIQEFLKKNTSCRSSHIRKRLIDEGFKKDQCECCSLGPEWQNQKLVMHLDHINGDSTDNSLKNLRILCPNCHSQTSTYCGKNINKSKK